MQRHYRSFLCKLYETHEYPVCAIYRVLSYCSRWYTWQTHCLNCRCKCTGGRLNSYLTGAIHLITQWQTLSVPLSTAKHARKFCALYTATWPLEGNTTILEVLKLHTPCVSEKNMHGSNLIKICILIRLEVKLLEFIWRYVASKSSDLFKSTSS